VPQQGRLFGVRRQNLQIGMMPQFEYAVARAAAWMGTAVGRPIAREFLEVRDAFFEVASA